MAGTVVADTLQAASTSTLVIKNGVANTPPTIQDSAGTQIGTFCRAFVNFNGTGTVAIRASFNVTSITDNGTGDYTVNFTTAMPDADYSAVTTASGLAAQGNGYTVNESTAKSASAYRFQVTVNNGSTAAASAADRTQVSVAIFR